MKLVRRFVAAGAPAFLAAVVALLASGAARAQQAGEAPASQVSFSGGQWEVLGGDARLETVMGAEALRLGSARAVRRDVRFRDGTIEFDVAMTPHRSFIYLQFRMASDAQYEEIYFRPHKSELPDAIQYTPVFRGSSHWQLFHGEGATAAAAWRYERWMPVRVEVSGDRAAVFAGDVDEPQLVVPRLAGEATAGPVAIRAFRPRGSPAPDMVAAFANVRIIPDVTRYDFSSVADPPEPAEGVVKEWEVVPTFSSEGRPLTAIPERSGRADRWRTVRAEPDGLLLLHRHLERIQGPNTTLARLSLRSAEERDVPLQIGYSDAVSVFLNGRILFAADDSYSYDGPRRQGLIGLDQATLFLPLETGENELVIAVTEIFGGWGLMARLPDRHGLVVGPEE